MSSRRLLLVACTTLPLLGGCMRAVVRGVQALTAPVAGDVTLQWTDTARQRALSLLLRLPAGEAPVPLVLLVGAEASTATPWVEAGIATLVVPDAADLRFVLAELARRQPSEPRLLGRLRLGSLGVMGLASALDGAAGIAATAWILAGSPGPRPLAGLRGPVLCIVDGKGGPSAWDALGAREKAELRLGSGLAPVAAVTTLWWRAHLLRDATARAELQRRPSALGNADAWRRSA